ncbi:MAG: SDR family NAD(P)-dependent oxidoreductase [Deltaproteobacteria bacterium]|nr:SDR family NAD(P)-dependent oxidoreductase [Deltaproteobacteria bacterium]
MVLVTGAGSGIGRATALLFAKHGARVHVVDKDGALALQTAADIASAGGKAESHAVDVSDAAAVEALAQTVLASSGRVDVLVNNAGVCVGGKVERIDLADWRLAIDVNLFGTVHGVRSFAPAMIAAHSGHIVNVASVAGLLGFPLIAPYVASKFALVGLSESMNAELEPLGVRVTTVCPGMVRTNVLGSGKVGLPPEWHEALTRLMARHAASPERIARDILGSVGRRRGIVVRAGLMRPLLVVKRLSIGLYQALARSVTRRFLGP